MSFESTPNRRNFLKILGAGVAATAIKSNESVAAPGYEKSPLFPEDTAYVQALFNDPATLKKFREAPHWRQVLSLIRVLARTETNDHTLPHSPESQQGEQILRNRDGRFVGNATLLKIKDEKSRERFFVVTAGHVADAGAVLPGGRQWRRNPQYDFAICEVSTNQKDSPYASNRAIDFGSIHSKSEDCTAQTGVIAGKNERGGIQKNIAFASMISPLLSGKVIFEALKIVPQTKSGVPNPMKGEEIRLSVIPQRIVNRETNGHIAVQGASGSRFEYRSPITGKNTFGGIFSTAVEQSFGGKDVYSLGFVVDASFIRAGIAEALNEKMPGS